MKGNSLFGAIRAFFVDSNDAAENQLTGVARYLQEHIAEPPAKVATSVERYLQGIDASDPGVTEAIAEANSQPVEPELSAVSQPVYQPAPSSSGNSSSGGFFASIRSFFVYDDNLADSHLTGVARYLQAHIEPDAAVAELETTAQVVHQAEVASGVARYLAQLDDAEIAVDTIAEAVVVDDLENDVEVVETADASTSVDKYMQEQVVIDSELPLLTGVEMYLQDQAALTAERAAATGVGEYLDQADLQAQAEAILAKYQQQDESQVQQPLTIISSVAEYIETHINSEGAGATSVGDYLERSAKLAEAEAILADYQARQQALAAAALPKPSSVEQYIQRCEQSAADAAASGVTAYVEKAVIDAEVAEIITRFQEREKIAKAQQQTLEPATNRVSVVKIRHRKPSSVARYISQLEPGFSDTSSALSGVDKFLQEQELITKQRQAAEIIDRYLARQEQASEQQTVITGVARYIDDLAETDTGTTTISSVSRYLMNQPAASMTDAIAMVETSVSRYLNEQVGAADEMHTTSSVDQYLANQLIEASKMPVEKLSGVDRYMLNQAY